MPPDPTPSNVPARRCAVLAGGIGRRMGGEKALAPLGGRRLVDHALEAVHAAGLVPLVVAKPATDLSGVSVEILREAEEPRHPLHGIATALEAVGEPLVVCPCDMPLLPGSLLMALARLTDECAVLEIDDRLQPLIGRYSPGAAEVLRRAAAEGAAAVETVHALQPRVLREAELGRYGDPRSLAANVNTPEDLALIEERLGR